MATIVENNNNENENTTIPLTKIQTRSILERLRTKWNQDF